MDCLLRTAFTRRGNMKQFYKVVIMILLLITLVSSFVMTQPVLANDESPQVICHYDHSEAWCSWCALIWQFRYNVKNIYICDDGGTFSEQYSGPCPSPQC